MSAVFGWELGHCTLGSGVGAGARGRGIQSEGMRERDTLVTRIINYHFLSVSRQCVLFGILRGGLVRGD